MTNLICYCFEYTEADIKEDILKNNGKSTLMERIKAEKKQEIASVKQKTPKVYDACLMSAGQRTPLLRKLRFNKITMKLKIDVRLKD